MSKKELFQGPVECVKSREQSPVPCLERPSLLELYSNLYISERKKNILSNTPPKNGPEPCHSLHHEKKNIQAAHSSKKDASSPLIPPSPSSSTLSTSVSTASKLSENNSQAEKILESICEPNSKKRLHYTSLSEAETCLSTTKFVGRSLQDDGGYAPADSDYSDQDSVNEDLSYFVKRIRVDDSKQNEELFYSYLS